MICRLNFSIQIIDLHSWRLLPGGVDTQVWVLQRASPARSTLSLPIWGWLGKHFGVGAEVSVQPVQRAYQASRYSW